MKNKNVVEEGKGGGGGHLRKGGDYTVWRKLESRVETGGTQSGAGRRHCKKNIFSFADFKMYFQVFKVQTILKKKEKFIK